MHPIYFAKAMHAELFMVESFHSCINPLEKLLQLCYFSVNLWLKKDVIRFSAVNNLHHALYY